MSLVAQAMKELERVEGLDDDTIMCYIEVVSSFEGKSGEGLDVDILAKLFRGENITPITNDPAEWYNVASGMWQNLRNSAVFSDDGGKTYHVMSEDDLESQNERHISKKVDS